MQSMSVASILPLFHDTVRKLKIHTLRKSAFDFKCSDTSLFNREDNIWMHLKAKHPQIEKGIDLKFCWALRQIQSLTSPHGSHILKYDIMVRMLFTICLLQSINSLSSLWPCISSVFQNMFRQTVPSFAVPTRKMGRIIPDTRISLRLLQGARWV